MLFLSSNNFRFPCDCNECIADGSCGIDSLELESDGEILEVLDTFERQDGGCDQLVLLCNGRTTLLQWEGNLTGF